MKLSWLMIFIAGCSALAAPSDSPPAEMEFLLSGAKAQADLGSFRDSEARRISIALKNDTAQACTIHKAVSNCDCTVPDLASRILAPGESMSVPVRIELPFQRTEKKLATQIAFDTSLGPKVCTLNGVVSPSLRISQFHIEAARTGSGLTTPFPAILVESLLPAELSEVSVESGSGRLEARIEKSDLPSPAFQILVSASKEALQ
jgi:hypothetical protein